MPAYGVRIAARRRVRLRAPVVLTRRLAYPLGAVLLDWLTDCMPESGEPPDLTAARTGIEWVRQ